MLVPQRTAGGQVKAMAVQAMSSASCSRWVLALLLLTPFAKFALHLVGSRHTSARLHSVMALGFARVTPVEAALSLFTVAWLYENMVRHCVIHMTFALCALMQEPDHPTHALTIVHNSSIQHMIFWRLHSLHSGHMQTRTRSGGGGNEQLPALGLNQ